MNIKVLILLALVCIAQVEAAKKKGEEASINTPFKKAEDHGAFKKAEDHGAFKKAEGHGAFKKATVHGRLVRAALRALKRVAP